MKQLLSRGRLLAAAAATAGSAGFPAPVLAETITMRLSVSTSANSGQGLAGIRFAEGVSRRSKGQLKIEVYPDGQLMREQETIDALINGVIDFAPKSTPWLVPQFPRYQVFETPFLFRDDASAFRVLDGAIGAELFGDLDQKGIVGLGWGFDGFKEFWTTNKGITAPEDLRGLRMRVQPGAVNVATYQSFGVIPVTIDTSEVFLALQQHVVDGFDTPVDLVAKGKLYTVAKHLALSNHIVSALPLLGSKRRIASLPAALQNVIREEGKAVIGYWRAFYAHEVTNDFQVFKNADVVVTDIKYAAFRKAVEPVYALVQSKLGGDLLDRIGRVSNRA